MAPLADGGVGSRWAMGHFAPLAAYEPARDAVLVADVWRDSADAYWLPLQARQLITLSPSAATRRRGPFALLGRGALSCARRGQLLWRAAATGKNEAWGEGRVSGRTRGFVVLQ